jgi:hypothetical protein
MKPRGLSATTDWTLSVPCLFGNVYEEPRLVFVNTFMLPHFAESTFNFMNHSWSFVLISAGADLTIPAETGDTRFKALRGFGSWEGLKYW